MRVDPRPPWHVIADAHRGSAGPGQPCRTRATVQIDRDVEPFATQSLSKRDVIEHPCGAFATCGDDHVVEMWIAANNRGCGRLDEIRDVRVAILAAQRTDNGCGENDVADQAQANEENPQCTS